MNTLPKTHIHSLHWQPYAIPLRDSFTTAHERLATRQGIIIRLQLENGIVGLGECAPLPAFSGGTMQDALAALPHIAATLPTLDLPTALQHIHNTNSPGYTTLAYGLETALLDALGQELDLNVSEILASQAWHDTSTLSQTSARQHKAIRSEISVNTVIGVMDQDQAVKQARQAVTEGFRCLKLKVGQGLEMTYARVAAIREAIGLEVALRLDANEAWNFSEAADILSRCERFAIQYVEQPLARHNLTEMARLREHTAIPIAADEMLTDLESAHRVLEARAATVFIVKPQLAGGLRQSQRIIQTAHTHNVTCVITSTIESGIGVCSALHLASATQQITLPCGLATLPLLVDDLLQQPLYLHKGLLTLPPGPGLGITLDRTALHQYAQT